MISSELVPTDSLLVTILCHRFVTVITLRSSFLSHVKAILPPLLSDENLHTNFFFAEPLPPVVEILNRSPEHLIKEIERL